MNHGYEEFVKEFRQLLLKVTGIEEENIYFKREGEEPAMAGDRLFMVCSEYEGKKEVCGLHIRDLYQQYCDGTAMEDILNDVLKHIDNLKQSGIVGRAILLDSYEKVRDSLCVRLLNREKYAWDLEDTVYWSLGDIAMVLYLKIGENDGILTTMKIRTSMLEEWKVNEKEAFETALLNTYYQSPPRFYPWKKWLVTPGYKGEAFMDFVRDYHLSKGHSGNCLSTLKKTNGGVAIFYPGVADRIAQLLNDSFYMVFTSIHEVMIHSEMESDPDYLRKILERTILEATAEEDFLTFNIYYYDKNNRKFSIVN